MISLRFPPARVTACVLGALCSAAFGGQIVVPNANATVPGNSPSSIAGLTGSLEVQEVIGSGQLPAGSFEITAFSFAPAINTGPFDLTIGSLSVYLADSNNVYPNTNGGNTLIGATFANNVGANKTLVFSGSNVTLSDAGCTSPPHLVCPFDLTITFTTPFFYDHADPLLIDMQWTNVDGISGAFDNQSSSFPPGGSVATVGGALGSTTGTVETSGEVLQITYTTVAAPEPTSWTMMLAGGAALAWMRRRRRSSRHSGRE